MQTTVTFNLQPNLRPVSHSCAAHHGFYIMEQQIPVLCLSSDGHGGHVGDVSAESLPAPFGSRWYECGPSGGLVRSRRGSDAVQKQKPCTLESIQPQCLLSIPAIRRSARLPFSQTAALAGVRVMSFLWYCHA